MKLSEEQTDKLIQALKYIWENDKTKYDYSGKSKANRNGKVPDSGRFSTPRELSEDALRNISLRPYGLVNGKREWR